MYRHPDRDEIVNRRQGGAIRQPDQLLQPRTRYRIVYFFTINHLNTLKEKEIHNINHCKYIDIVKAKQS